MPDLYTVTITFQVAAIDRQDATEKASFAGQMVVPLAEKQRGAPPVRVAIGTGAVWHGGERVKIAQVVQDG